MADPQKHMVANEFCCGEDVRSAEEKPSGEDSALVKRCCRVICMGCEDKESPPPRQEQKKVTVERRGSDKSALERRGSDQSVLERRGSGKSAIERRGSEKSAFEASMRKTASDASTRDDSLEALEDDEIFEMMLEIDASQSLEELLENEQDEEIFQLMLEIEAPIISDRGRRASVRKRIEDAGGAQEKRRLKRMTTL